MYAAVVWSPGLVSVGDSSVGEYDGQEILTVSGVFFDFRDDLTPVQSLVFAQNEARSLGDCI